MQRIVARALDKYVEARYQHVDELLADLRGEGKSGSQIVAPIGIKKGKPKRAMLVIATFAVVAIVATIVTIILLQKQPATPVAAQHRQVTFDGNVYISTRECFVNFSAISPDGQFVAYVIPKDSLYGVMVRDLSGGQPIEIFSGFELPRFLHWSPDGYELLLSAIMPNDEKVPPGHNYIIPRFGGKPQILPPTGYACWSPDGSQIAGTWVDLQPITFFDTSTGDTLDQVQVHGSKFFMNIDWSPIGNRLVFLTTDGQRETIWTVKTDGSRQQEVVKQQNGLWSPRWSRDGKAIYYLQSHGQTRNLMKIMISSSDGMPRDEQEILQTGLHAYGFTLSGENKKLSYTKYQSYSNLWLASVEGERRSQNIQTKKLTRGTSWFNSPALSPDGKNVVFEHLGQIYVMASEGGDMQQLTFLKSESLGPCWSPDGQALAFRSNGKIWQISVAGGTPHQFAKTDASQELSWSPGIYILYHRPGNQNFHVLDPQTEKERPLVANDSIGWIFTPRYSPDGKKVAVFWRRKDHGRSMWLISIEDTSQTLLLKGFLDPIQWSEDENWIYATNYGETPVRIYIIPVDGGEPKIFIPLPFEIIPIGGITMTPDGKRIICSVEENISDVWLMENFDPEVE